MVLEINNKELRVYITVFVGFIVGILNAATNIIDGMNNICVFCSKRSRHFTVQPSTKHFTVQTH